MAISPLQLTRPFPSPRALLSTKTHNPKPFIIRATDVESTEETTPDPETPKSESEAELDQFDTRLSQVRLRYRSGKGKKAEVRKSKKGTSGTGRSASGLYLPPVALKEAVSPGGLKVEFGFSPYSERINGGIAGLGLMALLLVELATGKSVINYHTPAIVLIQLYIVAAASALYIKYEKERISVWPKE